MNPRIVRVILAKELLDIARDRRAMILGFVIPLLLYPFLMVASGQVAVIYWAKTMKGVSEVAIGFGTAPKVKEWLGGIEKVKVMESADPRADLLAGKAQAVVTGAEDVSKAEESQGTAHVTILFDSTKPASWRAMRRLKEGLDDTGSALLDKRLATLGLSREFAEPMAVDTQDVTPKKKLQGYFIAACLSLVAITMITLSALYPAVDLTVGEKVRGTFETLLSTPISKLDIVCGKFLAVSAVAFFTVILNVGSMAASATLLLWQIRHQGIPMETVNRIVDISPGVIGFTLLVFFLILIPLALLMCAMLMSAALLGKDYKDANLYITPVVLLICYPSMAAMLPGVKLGAMTQFLPIVNVTLLFKSLLAHEATLQGAFAVFLTTGVYAVLALLVAVWLFQREEVILAEERGLPITLRRGQFHPRAVPTAGLSLLLYGISILLIFYVGIPAQSWGVIPGLLATEWFLLLLPAVIVLWYVRVDLRTALNLRWPSGWSIVGTVVIALGTGVLLAQVAVWQNRVLPVPEEFLTEMKRLLVCEPGTQGLWLTLFAIAVSPAICEEILFRGAILTGLRTKLPPFAAICVVGALFGLVHVSIWRVFLTALLGMVITYVVLRSESIVPGMLFHFLVNGAAVLLANGLLPPAFQRLLDSDPVDQPGVPLWLLICAVLTFLAGICILEQAHARHRSERC